MGASASMIEYEAALAQSDAAAWPARWQGVHKSIEEAKASGADEAALLAVAQAALEREGLRAELDVEYTAAASEVPNLKVICSRPVSAGAAPGTLVKISDVISTREVAPKPAVPHVRQPIVCLTDGSKAAHAAFVAARSFVKNDGGLILLHVKSDKDYLTDEHKARDITSRYSTALVTLVKPQSWKILVRQKRDEAETKGVVVDWLKDLGTAEAPPCFVFMGHSGRKAADRDPTILGQVTDVSLRSISAPCVVVKRLPAAGPHKFLLLVTQESRCMLALKHLVQHALKDGDSLLLVHAVNESDAAGPAKALEVAYLNAVEAINLAKCTFEIVTKLKGVNAGEQLQNIVSDRDPDYCCLSTKATRHVGSVSDYLLKHYKGNCVVYKGANDTPAKKAAGHAQLAPSEAPMSAPKPKP
ncbi:hypothetical protein M885DRAFT_444925 [Pelagophyceae sp. CCMP2097]|nr:hypothetical protein M885DRAFT_444925 [Pelagophyceae sp. CCMP2097]|mmetsp:Transcript_26433/g.90953  ORF Transcript_26433/g.90953 Transcript_26433/m.90953 type:complete len:415 (-) Transcript_26433:30-1274(-)